MERGRPRPQVESARGPGSPSASGEVARGPVRRPLAIRSAKLLAQDPLLQRVPGITQQNAAGGVVHGDVDPRDVADLIVVGHSGDGALVRLQHIARNNNPLASSHLCTPKQPSISIMLLI